MTDADVRAEYLRIGVLFPRMADMESDIQTFGRKLLGDRKPGASELQPAMVARAVAHGQRDWGGRRETDHGLGCGDLCLNPLYVVYGRET